MSIFRENDPRHNLKILGIIFGPGIIISAILAILFFKVGISLLTGEIIMLFALVVCWIVGSELADK